MGDPMEATAAAAGRELAKQLKRAWLAWDGEQAGNFAAAAVTLRFLLEAYEAALDEPVPEPIGKCACCGKEIQSYDGVVAYSEGTFCNRACFERLAGFLQCLRGAPVPETPVEKCQYCGFTAGEAESEFAAEVDARGVLDDLCGILFGDPDTTYDSLDDPGFDLTSKAQALVAAVPETPTEPRGYPPGPLIDPETPTELTDALRTERGTHD